MSYSDDDELKIDDMSEEEDLDLDTDLDDALLDDDILSAEDEEDDGFAGLDGSEY